jgi:hypothetical protein
VKVTEDRELKEMLWWIEDEWRPVKVNGLNA